MDDFDSVSWRNEPDSNTSHPNPISPHEVEDRSTRPSKRRTSSSTQQAGLNADIVDLGGIGEGRLDCTVDTPLKENDGTKDAYVSYLVTTNVRPLLKIPPFIDYEVPTICFTTLSVNGC